ncbi:MAG: hypothetical protein K2O03_02450, partial [Lachnospiraceae bacterium]|nr:hypothetical protein [Lachnospiraceae bacterium]
HFILNICIHKSPPPTILPDIILYFHFFQATLSAEKPVLIHAFLCPKREINKIPKHGTKTG